MAIDLRAAIQAKLGHNLPTYVAGLRAAGRSWREIAVELEAKTQIPVSHESLRLWYGEPTPNDRLPAG